MEVNIVKDRLGRWLAPLPAPVRRILILVIGSTVIVVTETDWVYGLNSTTGAVNWSISLGTPWNTMQLGGTLRDAAIDRGVAPRRDGADDRLEIAAVAHAARGDQRADLVIEDDK